VNGGLLSVNGEFQLLKAMFLFRFFYWDIRRKSLLRETIIIKQKKNIFAGILKSDI